VACERSAPHCGDNGRRSCALAGQLSCRCLGCADFVCLPESSPPRGTMSYFLATQRGLLAGTAVIYSLYPVGAVVLVRVLLGERLTTVRISGLFLAAASVGLITVGTVG
jgi:hypothetical protein